MKTVIFTLCVGLATPVFAAPSVPPAVTAEPPHYTCEMSGLSRIVLQEAPAPCCTGRFACPQLLSNTGLVKPRRDNRT